MSDTSEYLTFRQWLERAQLSGAGAAFRAAYLADDRQPNHTSQKEIEAYAKPEQLAGARETWAAFLSWESRLQSRGWRQVLSE